jgi:amino-acid N-acetyltransferase
MDPAMQVPMAARWTISQAIERDLPEVLALLQQCGLPEAGLGRYLATTVVARAHGRIIGSAALELYGPAALLRSVAAAPEWRSRGLGRRLVQAALDLAQQRGVARVYLLTETAASYFQRFGFRIIPRAAVEPEVQASEEFTRACCVVAQAMLRVL